MLKNGYDIDFDPWSQEAWATAMTGRDHQGCPTSARVENGALIVQHGDNPEAVVSISFDELNDEQSSGLLRFREWCDRIHDAYGRTSDALP